MVRFPPGAVFPDGFRQGLLRHIAQDLPGGADVHGLGIAQGADGIAGQGRLPGKPQGAVQPFQPSRQGVHQAEGEPPVTGLLPYGSQELLQDVPEFHGFPVGDVERPARSFLRGQGQFTGQRHILHAGEIHQVAAFPEEGDSRFGVGGEDPGHQASVPDADQPPGSENHCLQAFFLPFPEDCLRHEFGFDVVIQVVLLRRLVFPDVILVFLSRVDAGGGQVDQPLYTILPAQRRHQLCAQHIGAIKIFPLSPHGGQRSGMDHIVHALEVPGAAFPPGEIPRAEYRALFLQSLSFLPVPPQRQYPVSLGQALGQVFAQEPGGACHQDCLFVEGFHAFLLLVVLFSFGFLWGFTFRT